MSAGTGRPFADEEAVEDYLEGRGEATTLDSMRKLIRELFPAMRGPASVTINRDDAIALLTGQKNVATIKMEQQSRAIQSDTEEGDDTMDQVETATTVVLKGSVEKSATPVAVPAASQFQMVQQLASQMAQLAVQEESAKWQAERAALLEKIEEAKASAAVAAPQIVPMTPVASGVAVRIDGQDYPSVGGLSEPKLADFVPMSDPHFVTSAWRSVIRAGAVIVKLKFTDLVDMLLDGTTMLLVGERGCGKTTAIEQACALLQWPMTKVLFNKDIDNDILVGSKEAANGATFFAAGPLTRAMEEGHVFLADEVFRASPECTNILHTVMEKNATGKLTLVSDGGRVVRPHPNFRFVATDNTFGYGDITGRYVDCRVQDAAFLDRLTAKLAVEYPAPSEEAKIISIKGGVTKKVASLMVKLANDTRKALEKDEMNGAISTRALINWATMATRKKDLTISFALTVLTSMNPADQAPVVEMAQRHFGSELQLKSVVQQDQDEETKKAEELAAQMQAST